MLLTESIETVVLKGLQEGIPIEKSPFAALAEEIGIGADHLIRIIHDLKDRKIIRQISPIYDTRMLGFESLLVAFKVWHRDIEDVAGFVSTHPGVSHNYERDHAFNLWFTIAIPPDSRLGAEKTIRLLAEKTDTQKYVVLRSKRVFKIGVKLDIECSNLEREDIETRILFPEPITEEEKKIISVTQVDMPVTEMPFSLYAERLGMEEESLLDKLREFREKGIMRRFAAVLNHRKAGFPANGMAVWHVPRDIVDTIGFKIASFKAVSHCYERTTNGVWPYNLFSMIHAKTKDEVEEVVEKISKETGLEDYAVLYSTREFKKRRVRYFTEDLYLWEQNNLAEV